VFHVESGYIESDVEGRRPNEKVFDRDGDAPRRLFALDEDAGVEDQSQESSPMLKYREVCGRR
jgi:hypothetical protein